LRLKINIAVLIGFHPTSWLGGLNYYLNLYYFLSRYDDVNFIIITSSRLRKTYSKIFNKSTVLSSKEFFNKYSLSNISSKVKIFFLGKDSAKEDFLKNNDVHVLTHSSYLGRNSKILNFPIVWDFQEITNPSNFSLKDRVLRYINNLMCITNSNGVILGSKQDLLIYKKITNKKNYFLIPQPETFLGYKKINKNNIFRKYRINRNYFILPNQFWKHKNHITVLKSLKYIKDNFGCEVLVICTGNIYNWRHKKNYDLLINYINQNNLENNFKILGIVPRNDLFNLISHSLGLINPSLSEGESGSVEIAKALKKKCILSDIPSHKEQVRTNVFFFFPLNFKSLAKILIKNYKVNKGVKIVNFNLNNYLKNLQSNLDKYILFVKKNLNVKNDY
jgi:hypothetical protein